DHTPDNTTAIASVALGARLIEINGVAIDQAVRRESDSREETRSPVRLSWADTLPPNNRLTAGEWPRPGRHDVTVDSEVMSDLGLELGDELTFLIQQKPFSARISGSRGFVGGSSSVMFWFLFRPEALADFPARYMGGMQIERDATASLALLNRQFPTMRITELEQHIRRIRSIMNSLTGTIDRLMMMLMAAAAIVVMATALATSETRRKRTVLLRVLGLRRRSLRQMILLEFGGLGLMAGIVGAFSALWIGRAMFRDQFNLPFQFDWTQFVLPPLLAAVILIMLGTLFGRAGLRHPPLRLIQ
ncbi:MAG: FtsX-like permease family protein, partial [Wenzhouxiangellaceae bacterium]